MNTDIYKSESSEIMKAKLSQLIPRKLGTNLELQN